jgi:uncharacterized protein
MSLPESPYFLLFASGLLGGFGHCLGMCGPVVAAFSMSLRGSPPLWPHLLYNLGRVATYSLLGGAVGIAGSFLRVAADIEPLQRAILVGTGIAIALVGLGLARSAGRASAVPEGSLPAKIVSRTARLFAGVEGPGACFPLGMVLGLLPCGLVYAALLSAAREGMEAPGPAGAFLRGFLIMALFGAGTAPSLLALGKAVGLLGARMRTGMYRAAALAMALAGILFAARGFLG